MKDGAKILLSVLVVLLGTVISTYFFYHVFLLISPLP